MRKEDFFVPMDDKLVNGIHTPGNLPLAFDWKLFSNVEGLKGLGVIGGRLDHAYYLFHYASLLSDNSTILEIGTDKGASAVAMGMGIRGKNSKIITIDPGMMSPEEIEQRKSELGEYQYWPNNINNVLKNIRAAKLEGYIVLVPDTSENVLKRWDGRPIDMIHIDGSHTYKDVKIDCEWLQYIKSGRVAVFDDWMEPVEKAVTEYMNIHPEWELLTRSTVQPSGCPWKTVFWRN